MKRHVSNLLVISAVVLLVLALGVLSYMFVSARQKREAEIERMRAEVDATLSAELETGKRKFERMATEARQRVSEQQGKPEPKPMQRGRK
jgi:uncharacterized protein HemX